MAPEREQRETVAVQVVAQHEAGAELSSFADPRAALLTDSIAREAAPGEGLLVPATIGALAVDQVRGRTSRHRRIRTIGGEEREQRPCGLRRRARTSAAGPGIDVRLAAFSEPAVAVLVLGEPVDGAPHR